MRPFLAYSTLKPENCNGSICSYTVFCLPIFRKIEGGGVVGINSPPRPCGTEKSVVLKGLRSEFDKWVNIVRNDCFPYEEIFHSCVIISSINSNTCTLSSELDILHSSFVIVPINSKYNEYLYSVSSKWCVR